MSLMKKIKDVLFEEEEYTEPIKVVPEKKKEEHIETKRPMPIMEEKHEDIIPEVKEEPVKSERELFMESNSFSFPDFDEEEFVSTLKKLDTPTNVLEEEKKRPVENKTRFERIETKNYVEKKRFKPSPIISPVYGILNQDYKAEDIIKKSQDTSNINIEEIRRKAFEPKVQQEEIIKPELKEEIKSEELETLESDPVVTFIEDEKNQKTNKDNEEFKSIDELLESASNEIELEETLEMPATNNLDAIEEELEKLDTEVKDEKEDNLDEALESDLYELIDSMYEEREGE